MNRDTWNHMHQSPIPGSDIVFSPAPDVFLSTVATFDRGVANLVINAGWIGTQLVQTRWDVLGQRFPVGRWMYVDNLKPQKINL